MPSPASRIAAVLGLGGAAVLAVWLALRPPPAGDPPAAVESPVPAVVPAPRPAEPVAAVVPLPTPASAGIPEQDCILYPDGTRLPPLNGVKKAPRMVFHRAVPFTKVVRKERDPRTGIEWYVHENGARSTTRLQPDGGSYADIELSSAPQPVIDDK